MDLSPELWRQVLAVSRKVVALDDDKENRLTKENLMLKIQIDKLSKENLQLKKRIAELQDETVDDTVLPSHKRRISEMELEVPDSQGGWDGLDLTKNPDRNDSWWPEDFAVNPAVNWGFTYAMTIPGGRKYLHRALQEQANSKDNYMHQEAMVEFNRLAGPTTPCPKPTSCLPTPKTPQRALANANIDPLFKFELDSTVDTALLDKLDPTKVRQWLELSDSPPGHDRSSFPTSQQVRQDRETALNRSRMVALQRLFQAVYMVEKSGRRYSQVGKYIFKNPAFNEAVKEDRYVLDESVFAI